MDTLTCSEQNQLGFKSLSGREDKSSPARGIVNARMLCTDSSIEMFAGDKFSGDWNHDLACENGQKIVGIELVQASHYYKIENFRVRCG